MPRQRLRRSVGDPPSTDTHTLQKGLVRGRGLKCASLATHRATQDNNRPAGVIRTGTLASTNVGVDGAHEHTHTILPHKVTHTAVERVGLLGTFHVDGLNRHVQTILPFQFPSGLTSSSVSASCTSTLRRRDIAPLTLVEDANRSRSSLISNYTESLQASKKQFSEHVHTWSTQ